MLICVHIYITSSIHIGYVSHMCIATYIHIYIYILCIFMCLHVYIHTYIQTHVYIYTHYACMGPVRYGSMCPDRI